MLVLRKIGYAHWNQYYFDNMELDKLTGLVKKAIKELAVDEKLQQMNEDFAETKIIETPLTYPKYVTILEWNEKQKGNYEENWFKFDYSLYSS